MVTRPQSKSGTNKRRDDLMTWFKLSLSMQKPSSDDPNIAHQTTGHRGPSSSPSAAALAQSLKGTLRSSFFVRPPLVPYLTAFPEHKEA